MFPYGNIATKIRFSGADDNMPPFGEERVKQVVIALSPLYFTPLFIIYSVMTIMSIAIPVGYGKSFTSR